MKYILVLSLFSENQEIENKTISSHSTISDTKDSINNTIQLDIGKNGNINIIPIMGHLENKPSESDLDGYYLIKSESNDSQFVLYQKKTTISYGYIWNGASIDITKLGVLSIINIPIRSEENINNINNINNQSVIKYGKVEKKVVDSKQLDQNIKFMKELKSKLLAINECSDRGENIIIGDKKRRSLQGRYLKDKTE